ncbi:MAG TPA: hypothetical protein VLA49_19690 [Anaerolineales bacterium]|nr:hypothetical protein [Anaerolineales bacterium]
MKEDIIYTERLSSRWTTALFVALTLVFLGLSVWRLSAGSAGLLAAVFLILFLVFLFYSLNYRTLVISLTRRTLTLKFGLFTWPVPLENVAGCSRDELPLVAKYGGAGIHFMMIRKRYRVSFNFLEHPRVVVALNQKAGLVRDVSFSTRQPEELIRLIGALIV